MESSNEKTLNILERLDKMINYLESRRADLATRINKTKSLKAQLEKAEQFCPKCNQEGNSIPNSNCPLCRGLGKIAPLKCDACGNIIPTTMVHTLQCNEVICPYCGYIIMDD